jgi:hypothetical protein
MSFRLFIYYCTLCGGCAAYLGWVMGRIAAGNNLLGTAVKGMMLGMMLSLGLSIVDSAWNISLRRLPAAIARIFSALVIGTVGGFVGGLVGEALYDWLSFDVFLVFGWTITGFLIGISLGVFDNLLAMVRGKDQRWAVRKIVNTVVGGTIGGAVGGILSVFLATGWTRLFQDKAVKELWSPSATGFVALGLCIGLMIALAQVLLKEAWLRIEVGRRQGKELIVNREELTIGRAESCDLGLFGDPGIDRLHARVTRQGNGYLLADAGSAAGTYLNGHRLVEPALLRAGDRIQLGQTVLCYGERRKR